VIIFRTALDFAGLNFFFSHCSSSLRSVGLHLVELRERNAYTKLLDFKAQITNLRLTCGDTDVGAWFLESRCLIAYRHW
jgi:hypothetical protein